MPGSITIGGMAAGMLTGAKQIGPLTIIGSITECPIATPILVTGDNAIPVPAGATAFVFQPCSGLIGVKYRVTFGGDGDYLSPLNPSVISFDPANTPTSFYLNVGTAVSGTFSEINFI
jgi:hypothetical protein